MTDSIRHGTWTHQRIDHVQGTHALTLTQKRTAPEGGGVELFLGHGAAQNQHRYFSSAFGLPSLARWSVP